MVVTNRIDAKLSSPVKEFTLSKIAFFFRVVFFFVEKFIPTEMDQELGP